MNLELDREYLDRAGVRWRVTGVDGQRIAPVTAARWEGKHYHVRVFQRDGRYWAGEDDPWDLIAEAPALKPVSNPGLGQLSLDDLRRKRDQAWDLAGCARQDADKADEQRHMQAARRYSDEIALRHCVSGA